MSKDTHWRHDSTREVRYSRPDPGHQPSTAWPDARREAKGSPRARPNGRLPGLQGSGLAHSGRPLGSPVLSILAKGRHLSPEHGTAQQQEIEHRLGAGSRRSRDYELEAQRSMSPANGRHVMQEKTAHDASMSRLAKQSLHRRSLVPIELPPIDADRAAILHEVKLQFHHHQVLLPDISSMMSSMVCSHTRLGHANYFVCLRHIPVGLERASR